MTGRMSSRALARYLSFLAIATLTPSAMAQWRTTEWHQEVAPNGALRITVPMHPPPGAGGLEPELSFVYNSNRGDDAEIGVGWSIGGLSMITRCAKTPGRDGVNTPVQYMASDGFCLDGERLIPINGVNGMDGTEYRTERDTFAKIVSTGTQQALVGANWVKLGPQSFTVKTKSGRTLEYGVTANSRAQDPANTNVPIKAWGLNKMMDMATNYMTITYVTPTLDETGVVDDGIFYPKRIDYSGNMRQGLATSKWILFDWVGVSVKPVRYVGGALAVRSDKRIQRVDMYVAGSTTVRRYFVNQDYSRGSGFPMRITSIQECYDFTTCLPPVEFGYELEPSTLFKSYTGTSAFPGTVANYEHFFADLNGDGRKSWIKVRTDADEAWIGTAKADASFTSDRWTKLTATIGATNTYAHFFSDVDGDGKADWIRISRATNEGWVALGTGNGNFSFWAKYTTSVGAANNYNHFFADIDGDGRKDWVQTSKTADNTSIALATGGGNFQYWTQTLTLPASGASWDSTFADITGDGRADWLRVFKPGANQGNSYAVARVSNGDGTFTDNIGVVNGSTPTDKFDFADLNGDGLTDVVKTTGTASYNAFSTGNGKFTTPNNAGATYYKNSFADISGEGKMSRIDSDPASPSVGFNLYRSDGSDGYYIAPIWFAPPAPNGIYTQGEVYQYRFADLNGDGRDDLIIVETTSKKEWIAASQAVTEGRITSIRTKDSMPTLITYKPLNDATVFTPDTNAVYPQRNAPFPQILAQRIPELVSSVQSPNGIGGTLTTNYKYGGLRVDAAKLENHGFRFVEATQVETGITDRTEFQQNWPFTGLVGLSKQTITSGGNGGVLSQTMNSFGCNDFVSASGCQVVVGRRYFPFVSQSVTTSWDLNGAAFPTRSVVSQYDNFGNPTLVNKTTSDGYGESIATTYMNDTTKWWIGFPTRIAATNTTP